jgi:hypothetical protein
MGIWKRYELKPCKPRSGKNGYRGLDSLERTDFILSIPIGINSYPAIIVLSPGLEYWTMLMEVQSLQTLGWKIEENRLLERSRDVKTFH